MANNELFDEVLAHIETHQELWDQGAWFKLYVNGWSLKQIEDLLKEDPDKPPCGSAGCFAGNAILMEGWVPVFMQPSYNWHDYWHAEVCRPAGPDHGVRALINVKAAELLGIDGATAETLFNEVNTLDDLRLMVAHIKVHGNLDEYEEDEDYIIDYDYDDINEAVSKPARYDFGSSDWSVSHAEEA